MRFGTLAGVAAFAFSVVGVAAAQPTGSTAKADELFNEGRQLLEAGKFKLACVKFQQSLDEADALGTRLNLALCMEKRGKVYTAMVKFEDTAALAARAGEPSSEQVAREHAAALRAQVPTVTVELAKPVPGYRIVITRPGEPDVPVPASGVVQLDPTDPEDPGDKLVVRTTAPGFTGHNTEPFTLAPKEKQKVKVPELTPIPDSALRPMPPPKKSRRKLYAIGLGVAGAGMLAGSWLWASSIQDEQQRICDGQPMPPAECDYTGSRLTKMRYGATGLLVGGIAAIGAGAYLFITAKKRPAESPEGTAVVPTVTPDGPGIAVVGHF